MATTDTVVLGAGHAGLAVSHLLTRAGRDHVVLERGKVAHRWRTERWDSFRLLTPRWMTRLPGWSYRGPDPDGFMTAAELVGHLEAYAAGSAPVHEHTTVERVSAAPGGYLVDTDQGSWRTTDVVVATGPWGRPHVPTGFHPGPDLRVLTAPDYRNPAQLPDGGVLVVGGSSSGLQIADELARAGLDVTLSLGRHTRMPRRYRGMDVFWWLERTGRTARTIEEMPDPVAARREPSMQLSGRRASADLDLPVLTSHGVRVTGRLTALDGRVASFADDLAANVAESDRRMHRFLDAVDEHIDRTGLAREVWPASRPGPVVLPAAPRRLDLAAERVTTVVLAAGYRPHHPWLQVPVTDEAGAIEQHRGITRAPGLYVVGQRFQHRRDSSFIDGARHDAAGVVQHLLARTEGPVSTPAEPTRRTR